VPVVALGLGLVVLLLPLVGMAQVPQASERVRGLLVAVEAPTLGQLPVVVLRADDGRDLRLRLDPRVDVPLDHLQEHVVMAWPVIVDYVSDADGGLALRIDDG
jgi:hypothetical protein